MLIQQKQLMPELECAGVCFRPLEVDTTTAKFDLTLNFAEADQELRLTLEYSTDLFEAATARRMLGHLQTLLESAVANPEQDISELPLLTNDEQQQLLSEWNATARDYPAECVHSMFEKQVDLTPDSVAIVFGNEHQTYRELNARANQIAHLLQARGIGPESFVGIYIERTPEMVAGILGVLKAGGAYVPIDQTYPPERVKLILEDCGISALLTERSLLKNLPEHELPAICLDSDLEMLSAQSLGVTCSRITWLTLFIRRVPRASRKASRSHMVQWSTSSPRCSRRPVSALRTPCSQSLRSRSISPSWKSICPS
jgi:non-ribosomal peptide synthetase component F